MAVDIEEYQNLLRSSIDAKLSTMDSTFTNSIGLKLTKNKLLVWLNEPSSITLDNDFKAKIEQIASSVLYPYWILKHKAGLTLVPRYGEPIESARAISYDLHYGIYQRLTVDKINSINLYQNDKGEIGVLLAQDLLWQIDTLPELAIQAITRNGKTTLMRYLIINCDACSKLKVKNGAIDDGFKNIIVIDPKLDANLRNTTLSVNGKYMGPDFTKSDNNFIDRINDQLKAVVDLMRSRAEIRKNNPHQRFKDVFIAIDEAITIPSLGTAKTKAIYFNLLDRIMMMGAGFSVHVIMSSQSFIVGSQGALSSQARLEFGGKILLANRLTPENVQFLFKDLDTSTINNLILDEDKYGLLGVGIADLGDGIVSFRAPYIKNLGAS